MLLPMYRLKFGIVALRKESVDRNQISPPTWMLTTVALRKESVDRNVGGSAVEVGYYVALRKESVDRNFSCWLLA